MDYMPLVHTLKKQADAWSSASVVISHHRHLLDKKNSVADTLTKVFIDEVQLDLNYKQLATEQNENIKTGGYRFSITSLKWKDGPVNKEGNTIPCDVSTGRPCPYKLISLCRHLFSLINGLSHPSRRAYFESLIHSSMRDNVFPEAEICVPQHPQGCLTFFDMMCLSNLQDSEKH